MKNLIPQFRTERLLLSGLSEADAESYEKHFADYEVVRWLIRAVPWPFPSGGARSWIREQVLPLQGRERWTWGIFLPDDPRECVGAVDVMRHGKPENRGFWLARPLWGRGYMTEATDVVTDYVFDVLGFEKLVFANAVGNAGSHRIKEKAGARLLRIEQHEYVDPKLSRREIWELTAADWKARSLLRSAVSRPV